MTAQAVVDVDGLYAREWHALVRLAALLVDDVPSAEDVVQEAFLGLQRNHARVTPGSELAYLRASVVNGSRSVLRRRRTARNHQPPEPEPVNGADVDVLAKAQRDALVSALGALPRRQKEVLVLRYWSQLSEAEIAAALGVSAGTVKTSASRGLAALQLRLEGRS
ncbi:MAG: polymerase sigma factor, sigma-70 family/RNA polymerase sigma-70 factor, sigma-E family [Pseudonocardiales bacterium]|nr:polymerase sigma factor, sigma-70 family/RNA polymerase sigma-70 factor, sigma-E family [Pseudonocardiales bacterium]